MCVLGVGFDHFRHMNLVYVWLLIYLYIIVFTTLYINISNTGATTSTAN